MGRRNTAAPTAQARFFGSPLTARSPACIPSVHRRAGSVTTNGAVPNALVLGSDGAFYGTTQQGGLVNAGTFFKFTMAGVFTQIYSFNGEASGNNPITPNSDPGSRRQRKFLRDKRFWRLAGGRLHF